MSGDPRATSCGRAAEFAQSAGLPRVERLKVTDVTGLTIPEINS
jgi:hypothetical protein